MLFLVMTAATAQHAGSTRVAQHELLLRARPDAADAAGPSLLYSCLSALSSASSRPGITG
jgi:hypothetical protein